MSDPKEYPPPGTSKDRSAETVRTDLRLPFYLHRRLQRLAEAEGLSLNAYITKHFEQESSP